MACSFQGIYPPSDPGWSLIMFSSFYDKTWTNKADFDRIWLWWHHFKSYHEPHKGWVGAFASAFLGFTDFELKVRHHYPDPIIKPALLFPNSWPEELWCIQIATAWIMVCCNGPIELMLLYPHWNGCKGLESKPICCISACKCLCHRNAWRTFHNAWVITSVWWNFKDQNWTIFMS